MLQSSIANAPQTPTDLLPFFGFHVTETLVAGIFLNNFFLDGYCGREQLDMPTDKDYILSRTDWIMTKLNTIISPSMVTWARKRLRFSVADFAQKMGVDDAHVIAWEAGTIPISMGKAEKMANLSLLPLGIFFLDEAPTITIDLPDFRSVGNANVANASPELEAVILNMQEKQEWYKDYLIENDESPLTFVGAITLDTPVHDAVAYIRDTLEISVDDIPSFRTWEEYFDTLTGAIEAAGILFIRSGTVGNNTHRPLNVEEFRGFVLADSYAPLIFINGKDSRNAQLFTLIHELCHVFLGEGGISAVEMMHRSPNSIEKFCNRVAAEFLAPERMVKSLWDPKETAEDNVYNIGKSLKISSLVVIYRLKELGFISEYVSKELWAMEMEAIRLYNEKKKESGSGNFYATLKYKVGKVFAQTIIGETLSRKISYCDAFRLLGVKNFEAMTRLAHTVGMSI